MGTVEALSNQLGVIGYAENVLATESNVLGSSLSQRESNLILQAQAIIKKLKMGEIPYANAQYNLQKIDLALNGLLTDMTPTVPSKSAQEKMQGIAQGGLQQFAREIAATKDAIGALSDALVSDMTSLQQPKDILSGRLLLNLVSNSQALAIPFFLRDADAKLAGQIHSQPLAEQAQAILTQVKAGEIPLVYAEHRFREINSQLPSGEINPPVESVNRDFRVFRSEVTTTTNALADLQDKLLFSLQAEKTLRDLRPRMELLEQALNVVKGRQALGLFSQEQKATIEFFVQDASAQLKILQEKIPFLQ